MNERMRENERMDENVRERASEGRRAQKNNIIITHNYTDVQRENDEKDTNTHTLTHMY